MHNSQALRKGDSQFHTPKPSGKHTEENPRAFVLQALPVWTALVNEVTHGNTRTLLRKPLLLWGLSLLQGDLHSALNCVMRLFTRLEIHKKDPKTPKINHRTSVIDCLRLVSSYWDLILSNFFQVLSVWLKPLWLQSLHLYFGPLLQVCQTGKEPNSLCSTDLIISVFQLILDSLHKTKTVREMGRWLFISKKFPKQGWDSQIHCMWQPVFHQPCSADGQKKYVKGAFRVIVQISLMTEQWMLNAIFSCNLLLVWTFYLSWSRWCCMISFGLHSIMKNSILKVFFKIIPFKPNTGKFRDVFTIRIQKNPKTLRKCKRQIKGNFRLNYLCNQGK